MACVAFICYVRKAVGGEIEGNGLAGLDLMKMLPRNGMKTIPNLPVPVLKSTHWLF